MMKRKQIIFVIILIVIGALSTKILNTNINNAKPSTIEVVTLKDHALEGIHIERLNLSGSNLDITYPYIHILELEDSEVEAVINEQIDRIFTDGLSFYNKPDFTPTFKATYTLMQIGNIVEITKRSQLLGVPFKGESIDVYYLDLRNGNLYSLLDLIDSSQLEEFAEEYKEDVMEFNHMSERFSSIEDAFKSIIFNIENDEIIIRRPYTDSEEYKGYSITFEELSSFVDFDSPFYKALVYTHVSR